MPELPEVETTRRGLERLIVGRTIANLEIRERRLRWPVGNRVAAELEGRRIGAVERRGKYLLLTMEHGALLIHLGMSGSLRYLASPATPRRHDHADLCLVGGGCVRFNDPRRFGSLHFAADPARHRLLKDLGPEPLGESFTGDYLWARCRGRRVAIKQHLMNGRVVVGAGNIYATEALFAREFIRAARPAASRARASRFSSRVCATCSPMPSSAAVRRFAITSAPTAGPATSSSSSTSTTESGCRAKPAARRFGESFSGNARHSFARVVSADSRLFMLTRSKLRLPCALLAIVSVLGSVPCTAQGWFLTVGGGLRDVEVDSSAATANNTSVDENVVAEFGGGYVFPTNVVLEASTTSGFSVSGLVGFGSYEFEDDRLMVGYAFPVAERFRIVPEVGVTFWELRASQSFFFQPSSQRSTSGTDVVWRLAGEWLIGTTFGMYFSYTTAEFDVGNDSLGSVGMKVRF